MMIRERDNWHNGKNDQTRTLYSISITIVPEGTIKRSDGKAKRVIDRRKCNA